MAELRLAADEIKNPLFSVKAGGDLLVERVAGRWRFKPRLDSEAHLFHYQTLRRLLDRQGVLIPSPFDVMDGTIDVAARGGALEPDEHVKFPVDVGVALASQNQRVAVRAGVFVDVDPAFKSLDLFVKLAVDAFKVQLPPLDPIAGLPKVVGDPRIRLEPPRPVVRRNKPTFTTRLHVEAKTTAPGAIELLTPFAEPSIPISVEATRAADETLMGSVRLEPFRLRYLRRVVHVEHLRLLMAESGGGGAGKSTKDQADYPVDGRLRVDQTQYKVFIDVGGTLREPIVRFSSEPDLPKKDIVSVLLFDHVAEESSDAETAGNFEAAVADRAIGLFGIWAFASTPIRSFSYNPVTKVYAATVQLADGLTAGIGTNWEEAAHFEVRKRISKRWVLTASWAPDGGGGGGDAAQVGKLVLQWEKRF